MSTTIFPIFRASILLVVLPASAACALWLATAYDKSDIGSLTLAVLVIESLALLTGLPTLIWLYRKQSIDLQSWSVASAVAAGILAASLVILNMFGDHSDTSGNAFADGSFIGWWLVPIGTVLGAIAGMFWWLAVFKTGLTTVK